ncbi:MAG: helix-turn-helix transcriptional regulator [Clostridia bacterium]|nr:helix-turn-helix transcriptional regulator [Clostridia bacterium]
MKASYVKTKLNSVISIPKIVTIHYNEFDEGFVFEGESHDFWEMVYVDRGQVEICADAEKSILSQGEVIFHRPNEFHSIRAHESSPNFFVISFVCHSPAMSYFEKKKIRLGKDLKPFISGILREADRAYVILPNRTDLLELERRADAPVGSDQMIKTYLEQLLILMVRAEEHREPMIFPSKESLQNHLAVEIKQYIEDRLESNVRISEICAHLGYSKTYLSRVFHEMSGETMANYITIRKIDRAKTLVREQKMNFSEISERLGFNNPQYFSRVFRRVTGMSPSEFRQSLER